MIIEHDGTAQPVEEWAADFGLDPFILMLRLEAGWTAAAAIETPVKHAPGYRLTPEPSPIIEEDREDTALRHVVRHGPRNGSAHGRGGNPNGRETSVFIEHDGLRLSLNDWSLRLNLPRGTIYARIRKGHPPASILAPSAGRGGSRRSNMGRGYQATLPDRLGTGGGSSAQDSV